MSQHNREQESPDITAATPVAPVATDGVFLSDSAVNAQLKSVEEEMKALQLEIMREQVAQIKSKREEKLARARENFESLKQLMAQRERLQKQCTHRKGGKGPGAVLNGQGDSDKHCTILHVLPSGRRLVICQRCGKEEYSRDPITKEPATPGFAEFAALTSDNTASTSSLFLPIYMG